MDHGVAMSVLTISVHASWRSSGWQYLLEMKTHSSHVLGTCVTECPWWEQDAEKVERRKAQKVEFWPAIAATHQVDC